MDSVEIMLSGGAGAVLTPAQIKAFHNKTPQRTAEGDQGPALSGEKGAMRTTSILSKRARGES